MNAPLRIALITAGAAVLLSGCTRDMSDLEAWVEEIKRRPAIRIEPLPQVKPYETFAYTAHEHRSPFVPSAPVRQQVADDGTGGVRPDADRNREYLEDFPLDTLRMVGTVTMGGETYALIRNSDGSVHRVRVGNYLGQNHGRITAISEISVTLIEIIPDGTGGWTERAAAVALSE
ncbi:MAG: pilus assembly protein PilP [Gammaproteobacteria bacterium]